MILLFVFKDADSKDDPEYKFGDSDVDDDELLKQVLPDPVTTPHTNPSCEDSTGIVNLVERPARATETGPTSHVPLVTITCSTATQVHPTTSIVTTTSVQSAPLDSEIVGPSAAQAHAPPLTATPEQIVSLASETDPSAPGTDKYFQYLNEF